MSVETVLIETWLYETLTGDTTLSGLVNSRVYAYVVPREAALPAVVYNRQAGHDVLGVDATRILANEVYQVKVIGSGGLPAMAALQTIADRIDALLHRASGVLTGGQILSCTREQAVSYVEQDGAVVYSHLGGLYRILVRESP